MNDCTRPLIRYHGGKWRLAPWIVQQMPAHRVYVEPFGGGASVLLRKPRSHAEIYNDLDGEMVNLFRVARENGAELCRLLRLTPFARDEFCEAWHPHANAIERARRTVIRSFMGFGSAAITRMRELSDAGRGGWVKTGFRANSNRSGTTPAHDWANYPEALETIIARLQGVVIENKDAMKLMPQHDSGETLFYADPPYVATTRDAGPDYRYELTNAQHADLACALHQLRGMVMLSGYSSDLYESLYSDWVKVERVAYADGARKRVECLWLNPAAVDNARVQRMFA